VRCRGGSAFSGSAEQKGGKGASLLFRCSKEGENVDPRPLQMGGVLITRKGKGEASSPGSVKKTACPSCPDARKKLICGRKRGRTGIPQKVGRVTGELDAKGKRGEAATLFRDRGAPSSVVLRREPPSSIKKRGEKEVPLLPRKKNRHPLFLLKGKGRLSQKGGGE